MRYLITGGAGFIGSHLAERLHARGAQVVVLDDLSTGSRANLAALEGQSRFALHVGSAADAKLVAELVQACDVVLHLAAAVGVRLVVAQGVQSIATNLTTAQVVLEAAAAQGKPLLLASSSEVYGKSTAVPFAEDADVVLGSTTTSRWSYGAAKAMAEWLAQAHARERGLPFLVVRLFNTVGPRQSGRYGMVLPTFAAQALRGEPITVHGSGAQTRCFAHVGDTVQALLRLLANPAARSSTVNIGSDHEVSIAGLATLVRDLAGSRSPIVHVPHRRAVAPGFEDLPRRVPDLRRLRALAGFVPDTPLARIVTDVLADQEARLRMPLPVD